MAEVAVEQIYKCVCMGVYMCVCVRVFMLWLCGARDALEHTCKIHELLNTL